MNPRTIRPVTTVTTPDNRNEPTIIELVVAKAVKHHPWLRILGAGALGLLGALLLLIIIRLLLVSYVQGEMLDPLGRVVRRLDLSAGATRLVNFATFACSAGSLSIVLRSMFRLLLPLPVFRLTLKESVLLVGLFGLPMLAPDMAKKVCPVQEVDPKAVAWFDEAEDGSEDPHGLIGCVQEDSGGWWFCNVRGGPRPSDGSAIQPVTPEIHRQWKQWLKEEESKAAAAKRAVVDSARDERLRQQREAERKADVLRASQEKQRLEREQKEREQAVVDSQRRAHEAKMAEIKIEAERLETERAQLEKARAESEQARAMAEQARKEAELAAIKAAQSAAVSRNQSDSPSLIRPDSSGREIPGSTGVQRTEALSHGANNQFFAQNAEPPPQVIQLQHGAWRNIHVNGDRVEVWSDGPITLGADSFAPQTFPGGERHVRFTQAAEVIHAMPAASGTSRLFIRKLP